MACGGGDGQENWEDNLQEQKDEVLALESILEGTDILEVMGSSIEGGPEGNYTVKLSVILQLPEEGLNCDVWAPYNEENGPQQVAAHLPPNKRPQFMRSDSGRRWHSSFQLKYLPPLSLHMVLPPEYPSQGAPLFSISVLWLDGTQLSALCQQLDALWQEQHGMPIIYTWLDWLQNNTLSFLALERNVVLKPHSLDDESIQASRDPRALPECVNIQEDILTLLRYDQEMEMGDFRRETHLCEVCFDDKPGTEFSMLPACGHFYCLDCMTNFCTVHVMDGTVQQLACPDNDCKEHIPPFIIREVLGDQEYDRWERLLLQKALDSMGDVVWCPRCQMPVVEEAKDNLAHCVNCNYSFCTSCENAWHAGTKCPTVEDLLAGMEEKTKNMLMQKIQTKFEAGEQIADEDVTEELAGLNSRQLRARLRKLQTEYLTKATIKKISKPCPSCKVDIEKFAGCNKVTCSRCGNHMCWRCGKSIRGYEHFHSGSCTLFPGQEGIGDPFVPRHLQQRQQHEGQVRIQQAMQHAGNYNRIIPCPCCRQRCLKENRNNHIKCWQCKVNFCFNCKQKIMGTVTNHFKAGGCPQHGD